MLLSYGTYRNLSEILGSNDFVLSCNHLDDMIRISHSIRKLSLCDRMSIVLMNVFLPKKILFMYDWKKKESKHLSYDRFRMRWIIPRGSDLDLLLHYMPFGDKIHKYWKCLYNFHYDIYCIHSISLHVHRLKQNMYHAEGIEQVSSRDLSYDRMNIQSIYLMQHD